MIKRKSMREHGKIKLSRYFQKFKKGDRVAIIRELALNPAPQKKLQGRSGIIEEIRGRSYIVKIKDIKKEKKYIIHPAHMIKLK